MSFHLVRYRKHHFNILHMIIIGHGSKLSKSDSPIMHYPQYDTEDHIESECKSEVRDGRWQKDQEESQKEEQERRFREQIQDQEVHEEKKRSERQHQICVEKKTCQKIKSKCSNDLRSESRPSQEIERLCSKRSEECSQKHKTRRNTQSILNRLSSGSATSFSASLSLKSQNQHDYEKKIEAHVCVGQSSGSEKDDTKTEIDLGIHIQPRSSDKAYEFSLKSSNKLNKPHSKWNKQSILNQNLQGKLDIQTSLGQRGQSPASHHYASVTIKSSQSQKLKEYATESSENKKCVDAWKEGKKLTEECKKMRAAAGSLDVYETTVHIPSSISKNIYVKTFGELCKSLLTPYIHYGSINMQSYENRIQQSERQQKKYVLTMQVSPKGEQLSMNLKGDIHEVDIKDIRIPKLLQGSLPVNIRNSGSTNLMQQLTANNAPSTCSIENGQVKTFDDVEYDYTLNDCEHVLFKDCSQNSRVEVSVQKRSTSKKVKVIVDNHKYEVEIPSQGAQASIRVNGEEKSYIPRSQYQIRQQEHHQKYQHEYKNMEQMTEELRKIRSQKQQSEFIAYEHNYYKDMDTYVTSYEDGVYAIVSKLYGISVYADKDSIEVKTYQHLFRNRACGLCGDLNDEKLADVKSSGECIMSSQKLSAYSYMIKDSSCQGIPTQHQERYQQETEKCLKKEILKTPVSKIAEQKKSVFKKHLSEERETKICISKEQVNVCHSSKNPQEIHSKKVGLEHF